MILCEKFWQRCSYDLQFQNVGKEEVSVWLRSINQPTNRLPDPLRRPWLATGEVRRAGQEGPDHYDDVIMTMLASQITSLTVVYSIFYSGVNQRKHKSSASLAFVREIHRGPVNFPHKWPVTRKMFPFDDVIMIFYINTGNLDRCLTGWCPAKRRVMRTACPYHYHIRWKCLHFIVVQCGLYLSKLHTFHISNTFKSNLSIISNNLCWQQFSYISWLISKYTSYIMSH